VVQMGMLKWLVIGVGDITTKRVIPALLEEKRSELWGIVTRDPGKAAPYGVQVFTDLGVALAAGGADAVYVASPVFLHAPQTLASLGAGKQVLCEKPMAMNYAEARSVVEAARAAGLTQANSAEFDPNTPDPVVSTMADQEDIVAGQADLGGTMRLGAYPAVLQPDSIVAQAYQATEVSERHRHRYEVNNAYRDKIAESGLRFSGTSPDGHLVEFVEYPQDVHPFIVGTQAHPELKSRPTRPHPLFVAFIGAAIDYKGGELLPVEIPEQHSPNGTQHRDSVQRPLPQPATRG